jgi:hypothetical protein
METKFAAMSRALPLVAKPVTNAEQVARQARALLR